MIDWFSVRVSEWTNESEVREGGSQWVNHSFWNSSLVIHPSSFVKLPLSFAILPSSFILHHLSFILHQFVILPSSFTWWTTSFYFVESFIRFIGTVHDSRSATAVRIRNVNTVLLNGKIVIFKSLLNFIF